MCVVSSRCVGRSVGRSNLRAKLRWWFLRVILRAPVTVSEDSVAAGAAAAFSLAVVSTNANVRIGGSKQGSCTVGIPEVNS